jgi:hypothetical protein
MHPTDTPPDQLHGLDTISRWVTDNGGDPAPLYEPVRMHLDPLTGMWHRDPHCGRYGPRQNPETGYWNPRTVNPDSLCSCTGRAPTPQHPDTIGAGAWGELINLWYRHTRQHTDSLAALDTISVSELINLADAVDLSANQAATDPELDMLLPGVNNALRAALNTRTGDIHLHLLALSCSVATDGCDDIAECIAGTTFNAWLDQFDGTPDLAADLLAAGDEQLTDIIDNHVTDVIADAFNDPHWPQIRSLWADTWTGPWHQPLPDTGPLRDWHNQEAHSRLTATVTADLTNWAHTLRTSWTPLIGRRYLTETCDRGAHRRTGYQLINWLHPHGLDSIDIVDGPVAAYVNPMLALDVDTTSRRHRRTPAAGRTYADITDDTDIVIDTALRLAHDGTHIDDAITTARALYPTH